MVTKHQRVCYQVSFHPWGQVGSVPLRTSGHGIEYIPYRYYQLRGKKLDCQSLVDSCSGGGGGYISQNSTLLQSWAQWAPVARSFQTDMQGWQSEVRAMCTGMLSVEWVRAGLWLWLHHPTQNGLSCLCAHGHDYFLKSFTFSQNCYLRNTGSGKWSVSRVQFWHQKIWGYVAFYITFYSITWFSYGLHGNIFQTWKLVGFAYLEFLKWNDQWALICWNTCWLWALWTSVPCNTPESTALAN